MAAVFDHSKMEPGARLVLLALADHCDHDGYAWPTIDRLVHKTGLSRSSVKRCLKECELAGELIRTVGNGRGHTSLYRITLSGLEGVDNLGKGVHPDTLFAEKRVHPRQEKGSSDAIKGFSCDPLTINNHQEPRANDVDDDYVDVVSSVPAPRKAPPRASEGRAVTEHPLGAHRLVDLTVIATCSCGAQMVAASEQRALELHDDHADWDPIDLVAESYERPL